MPDLASSARFIVNSSPGAGLRFEASQSFAEAQPALIWAEELERRGMRMIRIRDTVAGATFDQRALREEVKRATAAARSDHQESNANE